MARTKKQLSPVQHAWSTWLAMPPLRRTLVAIGAILVALLIISVTLSTLSSQRYGSSAGKLFSPEVSTDSAFYDGDMARNNASVSSYEYDATPQTSMPTPTPGGGTGAYDESLYETRAYRAYYRTSTFDTTCNTIEAWKPQTDIIFERANRGEDTCHYTFKASPSNETAIVATLESLDPKDLVLDIQTVKKQLVRYSGELDILLQKQRALESMLQDATASYDELSRAAQEAGDIESLAKALKYKLELIQQLTRERTSLAQQIQRIERQMADMQDRVDFVRFDVTVQRSQIIDGEAIKDSWIAEMKRYTREVNEVFQSLTLGLLLNLLQLAQIILYLALLLVLVKYGWPAVKRFWQS